MKPGPPAGKYAMPGTKEEKQWARMLTRKAIRRGELVPQPCGRCIERGFAQTRKIHAHHEDYSKPLEITWLCTFHHSWRHDELRELQGKYAHRNRSTPEHPGAAA